uniref:MAM domain-containing protein n=1 Tax=Setaria digitata TaxID=48799 RepID=A0A915PYK3_9BILA
MSMKLKKNLEPKNKLVLLNRFAFILRAPVLVSLLPGSGTSSDSVPLGMVSYIVEPTSGIFAARTSSVTHAVLITTIAIKDIRECAVNNDADESGDEMVTTPRICSFSPGIIVSIFRSSSLDCNFDWTLCCWKNKGDGAPWQIYRGKSHDGKNGTILNSQLNEDKQGQFFLATSVTPEQRFSTDWTSCAICSRTGFFTVLVRPPEQGSNYAGNQLPMIITCTDIAHFYETGSPPITPFYIKLHNHGQSVATAVIENIKVVTEECYLPFIRPKNRSVKLYSIERNERDKTEVTTSWIRINKSQIFETTTIRPDSNSSFVLSDIFGDDFAKFLVDDSDGLIVEDQRTGVDGVNYNQLHRKEYERDNQVFATAPIPSLPFTFNILECNTPGGCLFDRSVCSYQNSQLSRGSTFERVRLYDRNFMQAFTRPNTIAVLETDTSFNEDHKIVFDVLEFTEGERLYGCCYNTKLEADETLISIRKLLGGKRPSELFCPFATATHSAPLIWRTERFTCPQGTEKILFMCENSGKINGTCAMDNIRIHKIFDVLEMEPCQKSIVAFS